MPRQIQKLSFRNFLKSLENFPTWHWLNIIPRQILLILSRQKDITPVICLPPSHFAAANIDKDATYIRNGSISKANSVQSDQYSNNSCVSSLDIDKSRDQNNTRRNFEASATPHIKDKKVKSPASESIVGILILDETFFKWDDLLLFISALTSYMI